MSTSFPIQVIVADDEYYARKALVKILQESDPDIRILAEMESGQAVMDYLKNGTASAHIVVTDIRMPGADGLEVARYIYENCPQVYTILVSGYADFSYAQQAITYGVKDYLVKPVQKKKLQETILRIKREYQEKKQTTFGIYPPKIYEQMNVKELTQSESLRRLLPELNEKINQGYPYLLYLMQADSSQPEIGRELLTFLGEEMRDSSCVPLYFRANDEILLFSFLIEDSEEDAAVVRLKYMFHRVLAQFSGTNLSAGVSLLHHSAEEMSRAYRECVCAINRRLLSGWNQLYRYSAKSDNQSILTPEVEETLFHTLKEENAEKATAIICRLFEDPQLLRSTDSSTLYSLTLGILNVISKAYRSQEHTESSNDTSLMFSQRYDLYTFHHLEDLRNYLLRIIESLCTARHTGENATGETIIHEILSYIERNYRSDLSLYELATEKYFMNPSYLSRLFKSVCGVPFSKYIIEVRMKKAKALLESSQLKVSDIAFHVGYNNPSHFINSFRKTFGVTPEEYRCRVRKETEIEMADPTPQYGE